MARLCSGLVWVAVAGIAISTTAVAQQTSPDTASRPAPGAAAPPRAAKATAKEAGAGPAAATGDAALHKRVEQLEEQLIDLQVVIGTLESLAKTPRAPATNTTASGASAGPVDDARLDGMEMQIKALTQQLEQLAQDVRGSGARRADAGSAQPPAGALRPDSSTLPAAPPAGGVTNSAPAPDAIGEVLSAPGPEPGGASAAPSAGTRMAAVDTSGDPKTAYEAAYGHMLQQNYGAAQAGFGDFLKQFPTHTLVPNALYWLGETYYVQKNYADAAEAFDIVLSAHAASNKAPDSQLKKAMALSQQGKNADACGALRQLAIKYPNAPSHVKTKADSERLRVGCS